MHFDEQELAPGQIRAAADATRDQDTETPARLGPAREAPPLTPAYVMAMQRAGGNHALARRIAGQTPEARVTARTSTSISGGRRLQRMRVSSAVMNGQYVGTSQNNPGPDATLDAERGYKYHYHANNYQEGDLRSITLTVWSETSGRRQHMTATEDTNGDWQYYPSGSQIISDSDARLRLENKIRLLREAQSRVRDISSTSALDMPLGALIANSEGRRGW